MKNVHGVGLGLRRELMDALHTHVQGNPKQNDIQFLECAPENWIGIGGRYGKSFRDITAQYPLVCHGLSLSLGSPDDLDTAFIKQIKNFLKQFNVAIYTEHLSYCSTQGHLYDLMPIPFTEEAVHYVAKRIAQVQDSLEQQIAVENISYYAAPGQEMSEIDFINALLAEAKCAFLLDVNNLYVNSINHRYDPSDFLNNLQSNRIAYIHIAGHYDEAKDLKLDTHGADVINPVWGLLEAAYEKFGILPTLLERDFNIPPLETLMLELNTIKQIQGNYEHA